MNKNDVARFDNSLPKKNTNYGSFGSPYINSDKEEQYEKYSKIAEAYWDESVRGLKMSNNTGRVIYKYQMPVKEEFTLSLPISAQILRVASENGFLWMWALVNTENDIEERKFGAYKTGGTIPEYHILEYIGCCPIFIQQELMLYIFEIKEVKTNA
jgi:hypothetical protein